MKYTRSLLLAASTLVLLISACSQPSNIQAPDLVPQFGTAAEDSASAVAINPSGALYTLSNEVKFVDDPEGGFSYGREYSYAVFSRFNRSGGRVWTRKLDLNCAFEPGMDMGCIDYAHDLETDSAGNAYGYVSVVENMGGDVTYTSRLVKYGPTGKLLWQRALNLQTPYNDDEDARKTTGMGVSAQGQSYVALRGFETRDATEPTSRLRKYDANGTVLWEVPSSVAFPRDVAVSGSGNVFVAGEDGLAKYGAGGALIWTRSFGTTFTAGYRFGPSDSVGMRLALNGSNEIYVMGNTTDSNNTNRVVLYKYNANGSRQWQRTLSFGEGIRGNDVSADAGGNVYVAGNVDPTGSGVYDLFVRKYTRGGGTGFVARLKLPSTQERANGVAAFSGSELYVAGETDGKVNGKNFGKTDAFLLRLNGQGQKVWSR